MIYLILLNFIKLNNMKFFLKINSKNFSNKGEKLIGVEETLKFMNKKYEDMERLNKPLPKKESLLLYRDALKLCNKFYWRHDNGMEWRDILLKSARKEFEENRNMKDSAEVGRKLVLGRQALIEMDEKILKVKHDMNKFIQETKIN
jgi:hypothetical protein